MLVKLLLTRPSSGFATLPADFVVRTDRFALRPNAAGNQGLHW